MVSMVASLYKADDCPDLAEVLAMAGRWTDCVIADVLRPIFVEAVRVDSNGWVEFTVDITVELTNHLLDAAGPDGSVFPVMVGSAVELPGVLFRVAAPRDEREVLFPPLPGAVTSNCPLCDTIGLMVSSVQAACSNEDCRMLVWDVTETRQDLIMNTVDQTLDPKFESP